MAAPDAETAERIARRRGILVEEIQTVDPNADMPPVPVLREPIELTLLRQQTEHLRVIRGWVTFIGWLFLIPIILSLLAFVVGVFMAISQVPHGR